MLGFRFYSVFICVCFFCTVFYVFPISCFLYMCCTSCVFNKHKLETVIGFRFCSLSSSEQLQCRFWSFSLLPSVPSSLPPVSLSLSLCARVSAYRFSFSAPLTSTLCLSHWRRSMTKSLEMACSWNWKTFWRQWKKTCTTRSWRYHSVRLVEVCSPQLADRRESECRCRSASIIPQVLLSSCSFKRFPWNVWERE